MVDSIVYQSIMSKHIKLKYNLLFFFRIIFILINKETVSVNIFSLHTAYGTTSLDCTNGKTSEHKMLHYILL